MKVLRRVALAAAVLSMPFAPALAQNIPPGMGGGNAVRLVSGFEPDPYVTTLTVGGAYPASNFNSICLGYLASQRPDFTLQYTAGDLPLYIGAISSTDATIVVRAPDGVYCDDDGGEGLNPLVSLRAPRTGRYDIWIGRVWGPGEAIQATLRISELPMPGQWTEAAPAATPVGPAPRPDYSLSPTFGSVALSSPLQPDRYTRNIPAGGDVDAAVLGGGCVGFVARAPDFRVNWRDRPGGVPLIFSVHSNADTTLVINDPSGRWICDDDSGGGRDPRIRIEQPPSGQYDIWIGTFREGPAQASTLSITQEWPRMPPPPR